MPTKFFRAIESLADAPRERIPGFLGRVESLRGVAALMVAMCHSQLVFVVDGHEDLWRLNIAEVQGVQALATKVLLALFNGGAAVSLFFVISGLVLGLSLDRLALGFWGKSASFLFRRAVRIYPALIGSLLLVQAWVPFIHPAPDYAGASRMFQPLYRVPQAADFFANLLFVSNQMNPVIWTLKVEMEVALLLPILHLINRSISSRGNMAVLALLMWLSTNGDDTSTEKWVFAFYLGLMLPEWGLWLVSAMKTSPPGLETWLGSSLVAFCSARHLFYGTGYAVLTPFVEGMCAMVILACVVYHPALKWWNALDWKGIRALGRLSYSFYLFHFIVHYLIGVGLFHSVSPQTLAAYPIVWHGLLGIVSVALTLPLAVVSYRWVEKVFIEWGKELTRRLEVSFRRPMPETVQ